VLETPSVSRTRRRERAEDGDRSGAALVLVYGQRGYAELREALHERFDAKIAFGERGKVFERGEPVVAAAERDGATDAVVNGPAGVGESRGNGGGAQARADSSSGVGLFAQVALEQARCELAELRAGGKTRSRARSRRCSS
jgi:hypothetical protein